MSLTSFLKTPGIAARCAEFFPFEEQRFPWPTLAPRLSSNPQLIGTAFDYIVRFHLQKWSAPRKFAVEWIAATGLSRLHDSVDFQTAKTCYERAWERLERFQNGAPCDDDLLASSLHLAQLDEVFRGAKPGFKPSFKPSFQSAVSPTDQADLRGCTALLSPARFRWEEALDCAFPPLLNPTFGIASALVGGADADFCAANTLFEIKTVREAKITPFMHFQLLGYCALHELASIGEEEPRRELEEVAIYFSRFGRIARFKIGALIRSPRFDDFLAWFAARAAEQFGNSPLLPHLRRLKND